MRRFLPIVLLLSIFIATPAAPVRAQDGPSGPIYIVQAGDTLYGIAARFNADINALITANALSDANQLAEGQKLVIPGLEGLSGTLQTTYIEFGTSLRSLSRSRQIPAATLVRLNRLTSPEEFFVGARMVLLEKEGGAQGLNHRFSLAAGATLLEQAVLQGSSPWLAALGNGLAGTHAALPGDSLYLPGEPEPGKAGWGGLAGVNGVEVTTPLLQGTTVTVTLSGTGELAPTGLLVDHPLAFFPVAEGKWTAIQGVHAMLPPGLYPLQISINLPDGSSQSFEQRVAVEAGDYLAEDLVVEPEYIDPLVTESEFTQVLQIVAPATPVKYWEGLFLSPGSEPGCLNSRYGNRRTYYAFNSPDTVSSFHSGIDYCGGTGLPIYAPASGKVVFAGPLTVRGNATIIDHGWGVYSGIWHQSEIRVQVGELVSPGQVIGLFGGTGRVTGAHLHWEVWANGVQVDPVEWLEVVFP